MELPVHRRNRPALLKELAPAGHRLTDQARNALCRTGSFDCAITFWLGTSGHPYVHSIYTLPGCPPVPPASVILAHRPEIGGNPCVLKVLSVENEAASLNLAKIRHLGARIGANEVHLHFAAGDRAARNTAVFDLATRYGGIDIVGK